MKLLVVAVLWPALSGVAFVVAFAPMQLPELAELEVGLANFFVQHTSASLTINENASPGAQWPAVACGAACAACAAAALGALSMVRGGGRCRSASACCCSTRIQLQLVVYSHGAAVAVSL